MDSNIDKVREENMAAAYEAWDSDGTVISEIVEDASDYLFEIGSTQDPRRYDEIEGAIAFRAGYLAALSAIDSDAIRSKTLKKAADRAVAWQVSLCKSDNWFCECCTECNQLRYAILSAEPAQDDRLKPSNYDDENPCASCLADDPSDCEKCETTDPEHVDSEWKPKPAQDDGKPEAVMTMIENGDMSISWECSACKKLIDDREDIEAVKICPHCGASISDFLYIEEAEE